MYGEWARSSPRERILDGVCLRGIFGERVAEQKPNTQEPRRAIPPILPDPTPQPECSKARANYPQRWSLSGLFRTGCPVVGLYQLHPMRLGTVRVMPAGLRVDGEAGKIAAGRDQSKASHADGAGQLDLLPRLPASPLPVLDQRSRGTQFIRLEVHSVLNTPAATRMGFWSINPYVGCEFGCMYCYARDTHRWVVERAVGRTGGQADGRPDDNAAGPESDASPRMLHGLPPYRPSALPPEEAFEKEILVKSEVAEVLARTLNPAKLAGDPLVIGTATDPYQPAERRFRLTRRILEVLRSYQELSIEIITKSPLVTRDIDLLQAISQSNDVSVNISLATADPRLARRLELRSPIPAARLRALRRLTAAGIHAGLIIAPIIPGITDDWAGLARLMEAAKEAGAHYVIGSALRLGPAARHRFLPFLEREFPDLYQRYRRHYAGSDVASRSYQDALTRRLNALRQAFGFAGDEASSRRRRRLELAHARSARVPQQEQAVLL
jgi:DNA repair photolyase